MKKKIIVAGVVVVAGFIIVHKFGGEKMVKYCPFVNLMEELCAMDQFFA